MWRIAVYHILVYYVGIVGKKFHFERQVIVINFMGNIFSIKNRIVADYFVKSRLGEYKRLIEFFLRKGFVFLTLSDYYNSYYSKNAKADEKIILFRHDIDTDPDLARKMFEIELAYKVPSTFYFRLSTIKGRFAREIKAGGSEVGYHFEEIASFAKKNKIHDRETLKKFYPEIRAIFISNFKKFQEEIGFKVNSVSSHGDFINRRLNVINYEILDQDTRKLSNILFEAYDLLPSFDDYLSDLPYPEFWKKNPYLSGDKKVICLLTHPRHWKSNPLLNTQANIQRLIEDILYRFS